MSEPTHCPKCGTAYDEHLGMGGKCPPTEGAQRITPALWRRIEALGFKPGERNPVEWLVSTTEAALVETGRAQVKIGRLLSDLKRLRADLALHECGMRLQTEAVQERTEQRNEARRERDEARAEVARLREALTAGPEEYLGAVARFAAEREMTAKAREALRAVYRQLEGRTIPGTADGAMMGDGTDEDPSWVKVYTAPANVDGLKLGTQAVVLMEADVDTAREIIREALDDLPW